ncbi:MAG: ATP synthase subunit I [SAR324 cluster bacterium]|nr:ATP synthase subunit I [SAR324 cluster bacterium]
MESNQINDEAIESQHQQQLGHVNAIWNILVVVSLILVGLTAVFHLDFLPGTLLGCAIVGLNFYWTRRIVTNVFSKENVKRRMLLVYVVKFGLSITVLFVAVVLLQISALGLLIGLSNIVIAVILYAIASVFRY